MQIPTVEIVVNGRKKIVNADDPRAITPSASKLVDLTRESVAKMGRADVVAHLKAHGVETPKGKIDDLRAQLINIVFLEI